MTTLILDVESYPHFIPFCQEVRLIRRTSTELIAELVTTQGWSYTSQVRWTDREIDIAYNYFDAQWTVSPLIQGCKVSFSLGLGSAHFIKRKVMEGIVSFLAPQMIQAFIQRAHFLYG